MPDGLGESVLFDQKYRDLPVVQDEKTPAGFPAGVFYRLDV